MAALEQSDNSNGVASVQSVSDDASSARCRRPLPLRPRSRQDIIGGLVQNQRSDADGVAPSPTTPSAATSAPWSSTPALRSVSTFTPRSREYIVRQLSAKQTDLNANEGGALSPSLRVQDDYPGRLRRVAPSRDASPASSTGSVPSLIPASPMSSRSVSPIRKPV